MSDNANPAFELQTFEKTLAIAIDKARSLDEVEAWLKSQPHVESVQLARYVLKSNPTQRDFIIEIRTNKGSPTRKIVNLFDLGNQQFQFHNLRDEE